MQFPKTQESTRGGWTKHGPYTETGQSNSVVEVEQKATLASSVDYG